MTLNPLLSVSQLTQVVHHLSQPLTIFRDLSFAVSAQETVAIVGASGSGKSTLLSMISGLETATSGSVTLLGHELNRLDEDQRAKVRLDHVGFVFQNFQLMPTLTALENVMLPLELAKGPQAAERAKAILARVGLSHRLHHYPKYLSGGEQQRVAIARAFVNQPKVLFADEPTGSLDPKTAVAVMDLLFELNQEQGTVLILVTHDMGLAQRCGRTLVLSDSGLEEEQAGNVVLEGSHV
ncbi:MAG: ABC transporter ATP-binding protein [Neisseriaceae bacterium]|nr:ABC transporter ATP-binding protein [Neisseriaceae bacterium]MBP6862290.1 ABC transporter ATP-binding protein [Neisseriaceae bacterium]